MFLVNYFCWKQFSVNMENHRTLFVKLSLLKSVTQFIGSRAGREFPRVCSLYFLVPQYF